MLAAARLRLLEARRRGGLYLLGGAAAIVLWVALFGGETVDGRYGLASDLAATFGYLGALFFGALPLAADRERKRSYLPGASPVAPWAWALGNAAGAALLGLVGTLVLFAMAAFGANLRGGIETHATTSMGMKGTAWLPLPPIRVPEGATHMRFVPRVYLSVEQTVGTTDSASVDVDGETHEFFPNRPIVVPIRSTRVQLKNLSDDHAVGIDLAEVRTFVGERSFLLNALGAGVGPSLGAASLAALGTAASANLTAPVAALLAALILMLGSLKGFMQETMQYEGAAQRAKDHGHQHEQHVEVDAGTSAVAKTIVDGLLHVLPDLNALDRTDRVAIGQWTHLKRSETGLLLLAISLAVAAALGGIGVHNRRLP